MLSPKGLAVICKHIPYLDDWADGKPDAWNYDKVLRDNEVTVDWCDQLTSDGTTFTPAPPDLCGWGFSWRHGAIFIGQCSEKVARKAAALRDGPGQCCWRYHADARNQDS